MRSGCSRADLTSLTSRHRAYMLAVSKSMAPKTSHKKQPPSELERYPRPSLAVDVAALTVERGELRVALYKRSAPPQRGHYALPGGFVHIDESIEDAIKRLMAQKVGLAGVFLEQLYTFGDVR